MRNSNNSQLIERELLIFSSSQEVAFNPKGLMFQT